MLQSLAVFCWRLRQEEGHGQLASPGGGEGEVETVGRWEEGWLTNPREGREEGSGEECHRHSCKDWRRPWRRPWRVGEHRRRHHPPSGVRRSGPPFTYAFGEAVGRPRRPHPSQGGLAGAALHLRQADEPSAGPHTNHSARALAGRRGQGAPALAGPGKAVGQPRSSNPGFLPRGAEREGPGGREGG